VPETVSDTGPALHLQEIGQLALLSVAAPLILPDLVVAELESHSLGLAHLREAAVEFTVFQVPTSEWREILQAIAPQIQPADAQVFAVARANRFQALALTDDLTLRRLLESHGAQVAGTVGILVRAYASGRISPLELRAAIDSLFTGSSLFISRAFRTYLKNLLIDLS
jgi:predicted nucleic acid-binding protein